MDDAELARLEHENMIHAFYAVCSMASGALISREGGIALIASGIPIRLFNQVLVEWPDATEAALTGAFETIRDRGERFMVSLRAGTDDRFAPLMDALGLEAHPTERMPGMALHPLVSNARSVPHEDAVIRRIEDEAGLEDHIQVVSGGFEIPEDLTRRFLGPATLEHPDIAVYVGYDDGIPVSAGLGFRTGPTIGVYNIATLPAFRRRGLGAAMTRRIVEDGAASGCQVAILQSSEMGLSVYERLGFRTVVEYLPYVPQEAAGGVSPEG